MGYEMKTEGQVKVKILDRKTGISAIGYHEPKNSFHWCWVEGNYSCDCNRLLYFSNSDDLEKEQKIELDIPENICLGNHRFVVTEIDDDPNHSLIEEVNQDYT